MCVARRKCPLVLRESESRLQAKLKAFNLNEGAPGFEVGVLLFG